MTQRHREKDWEAAIGGNVVKVVIVGVTFGTDSDISADGSAEAAAKVVRGLPPPSLPFSR